MSYARKQGLFLLLSMAVLYFCANLQKIIIPGSTFNELQHLLGVDATAVTKISSSFFYVYAFMQLIVGPLSDRYGGARVTCIGALFMGVGAVLSSYLVSLPLLMFSRALTGLGAAVMYLATVKEIARMFPSTYATCVGILLMVGYSGSIIGAAPFVAGIQHLGYHKMVLGAGVFCMAAYLLFLNFYWKSDKIPVNKETNISLRGYLDVFKVGVNNYILFTTGLAFGMYYIFQVVIGKKLLEDYCGMTPNGAGIVITVTMLIAACNGFFVAILSRLIGNRRRPFILFFGYGTTLAIMIILVAIFFNCRSCMPVIIGLTISAFAGNQGPIMLSILKEANEDSRLGTVLSVNNSFSYIVPALLGALCGRLMDVYEPTIVDGVKCYGRESYLLVISMMLGFAFVSLACSHFVTEPGQRA